MKNLNDFNTAISTSGAKVMCVCFHNGCPGPEKDFDGMKSSYPNVCLFKVNTLNSDDIKNKYADGGSKPYFKFYKNGSKIDEVAYKGNWGHKQDVMNALSRHNGGGGGGGSYNPNDGKVLELKSMSDFNSAISTSGSKIMAVCFHNGCSTEEKDYDGMKGRYPGVCLFKVNTLNSDDIKNKYADGSSKPYFKAYRNGSLVDQVKYGSWSSNKGKVEEWLARHNGGGGSSSGGSSSSYNSNDGKVYQLKNISEFNNAVAAAGSKYMAVCYHNGCRTEEDGWDAMKSSYPNVHMYKVNTLNSDDIKNAYADGSSKPYWKFYVNGIQTDEVKYKKPWSDQEPILKENMSRFNSGSGASSVNFSYSQNDGKVKELDNLREFDTAVSVCQGKVMAVCYHNGCATAEAGYDKLKSNYPNVHFYKVNTLKAKDIKDKYADGGSKPYFKYYRNGALLDETKYESSWSNQEPKVKDSLGRHNGGAGGSYSATDGKVKQLKNLTEFNTAMQGAGSKIVAVCYHNGCPTAERGWDEMKGDYMNVHMYKVNTLDADDIKAKYADGSSKPYFKFYKNSVLQDEVSYVSSWSSQEPKVREMMQKHNGGGISYTSSGTVYQLRNLDEFNQAVQAAGSNIMAVCYHNGCRTAEDAFDGMKTQYPKVHMYKVNTLNADDIKSKYADGSSKPYFKFYKNGQLTDEVKYEQSWSSHEPKVRAALNKHNGGNIQYSHSDGKVYELKNLNEFNDAMGATQGKIMAVCYHNGCPTAEKGYDEMKAQYHNVHMYKVNTLNAKDIKDKYADGSSKPYFKFYKDFAFQDQVKYDSNWTSQKPNVAAALNRHNGGSSGSYSSSGKVTELKDLDQFNTAISTSNGAIMAVCFHNGCATEEQAWDGMKSDYSKIHMYKVNTLNSDDIKNKYADGSSKPYWKFYKNGNLQEEVKYKKPWSDQEPILRGVMSKHNGGGGGYSTSGKVVELKNLTEFNQAVSNAANKIMGVCFHNGCPTAEEGWDNMKSEYTNVHMYKVNTLNAYDIKDKYADGGSKPYFKFYKNGTLVNDVKYQSSWSKQEPAVRVCISAHNGGDGGAYNIDSGSVYELKNLSEFNDASSAAGSKVLAICYHNDCPTAEKAWDKMKATYREVHLYKVNTINSRDIKDKYADGGSKPYFKFYRNGDLLDEVKYESNWSTHEPKVKAAMAKHNGGGSAVEIKYDQNDGKVQQLQNLGEFNGAIKAAGNNIMAVCFHNGNPTPEAAWDKMKKDYGKVQLYKVNTLQADDIKGIYADGSAKPFFKFYKNGQLQDEVKHKSSWNENEPVVKAALARHNGSEVKTGYDSSNGFVTELGNLGDFNKAVDEAGANIMAVCYHNGCPTPEAAWDKLKSQYPKVHMYKVNTLNSDDIKNKYADGSAKPFFKFYSKGEMIDQVKYMQAWQSNEPNVKAALKKAQDGSMLTQGNSVQSYSSYTKVYELKNIGEFDSAVKTSGQKIMCVMYHNGNPTQEEDFDGMKQDYTNVHMYKVNTLEAEDIKSKYADGSSKPYFKFYKAGSKIDEVKHGKWTQQEIDLKAALGKHDGQDANTSAVNAQLKLEGDLKAAESQAASKAAEAEKSKKERAEAESKAKAAEEKAAALEAQLRAMMEQQAKQAAAAQEEAANSKAKALEEQLRQMQEETRRQQEEASRKKEEEEYQRKMAEEAAATKKREEEETARKKQEAEAAAKAAAEAAAEEAAAAAKEAAKPKDGGGSNYEQMSIKEFFEIVAKEWGKPLAKLQQYLENLEDEMIDTVKDLDLQVSDEKSWGEITASWPKALPKRIEAKLSEMKAAALEAGTGSGKEAFPFVHKECWIFYEPEYEILRSAPGNEMLGDLPATSNDAVNAKRIALRMGIPEANIHQYTKMTTKAIQQVFRNGTRTFLNKSVDGKRTFLLVYVAGHGVCDQMQYFVLNDAEHNLVNIEEKLRTLSKGTDTSILTFYDICRSDKSKFPNLKRGTEAGPGGDNEGFAENYQYMHICTHPLQTVDAKSKLAELTIKQLTRKSGEDSGGLIFIPNCFIGMGGIEKTDTGDGYSLTWKKTD